MIIIITLAGGRLRQCIIGSEMSVRAQFTHYKAIEVESSIDAHVIHFT